MKCCAARHIVEEDCPARLLILDSPACRQLVRDGALGAEKEGTVVGGKARNEQLKSPVSVFRGSEKQQNESNGSGFESLPPWSVRRPLFLCLRMLRAYPDSGAAQRSAHRPLAPHMTASASRQASCLDCFPSCDPEQECEQSALPPGVSGKMYTSIKQSFQITITNRLTRRSIPTAGTAIFLPECKQTYKKSRKREEIDVGDHSIHFLIYSSFFCVCVCGQPAIQAGMTGRARLWWRASSGPSERQRRRQPALISTRSGACAGPNSP